MRPRVENNEAQARCCGAVPCRAHRTIYNAVLGRWTHAPPNAGSSSERPALSRPTGSRLPERLGSCQPVAACPSAWGLVNLVSKCLSRQRCLQGSSQPLSPSRQRGIEKMRMHHFLPPHTRPGGVLVGTPGACDQRTRVPGDRTRRCTRNRKHRSEDSRAWGPHDGTQ
jgi:hypothetical protein